MEQFWWGVLLTASSCCHLITVRLSHNKLFRRELRRERATRTTIRLKFNAEPLGKGVETTLLTSWIPDFHQQICHQNCASAKKCGNSNSVPHIEYYCYLITFLHRHQRNDTFAFLKGERENPMEKSFCLECEAFFLGLETWRFLEQSVSGGGVAVIDCLMCSNFRVPNLM